MSRRTTDWRFAHRGTLVLILLVAILTVPGSYHPTTGGLDPSWMWGLNAFAAAGFQWGRDVIFSYGPLGYIARPLQVGQNISKATTVYVVMHVVVFGTVGLVLIRRTRVAPVLLFLAAYPIIVASDLEFDYQMMAVAGLLASVAIELAVPSLLIFSTGIASSILFIKFGTGLASIGMLIVACALWAYRRRTIAPIVAAAAAYALCGSLIAWRFFDSPGGLLDFLKWSTALSRGYNDSMSVAGPIGPLLAAACLLVLFIAMAWYSTRTRLPIAASLLVFAIPILFSAKHAFLRADWEHMPFFFGLFWWIGAAAVLLASDRRAQLVCAALLISDAALFAATADARQLSMRTDALASIATGDRARSRLDAIVHRLHLRHTMRQASRAYLNIDDRLPAEWTREIGRKTVLVVPWELALCPANDLVCVPYPTLQMYATLTADLDRWTAARLRARPAEFVIVDLDSIDGRNMIWDCPETWLALMEGWEVSRRAPERPRLLLRRRVAPRRWTFQPLTSQQGQIGAWIDVPETPWPLRAAIDLKERLTGRLSGTFLRSEPVLLHVRTASGRQRAYRLIVDTARLGLLIHATPRRSDDLAELFDCCPTDDPVRSLRVTGPGAGAFEPRFAVEWSQFESGRAAQVRVDDSGPLPPITKGDALMAIDSINGAPLATAKSPLNVQASRDGIVQVDGWAFDRDALREARGVVLRWDEGRLDVPADYRFPRPDVAAYFGQAAYRFSGFHGVVSADDLGPGRHRLQVIVISADGKTSKLSPAFFDIDVR